MNVLSCFDGMSCGQIALNRIGVKYDNYFASEIDKYAITVTQHNYPNTKQIGDIKGVKSDDLPSIDLLIGGSPCQNLSFAGKQNGLTTKCNLDITSLEQYLELKKDGFEFEGQSYLFWEFVRLLKEVKPKYFLLENVKMSKKWLSIFNKIIGVNGVLINSSLVSAQNRERYYWTNIPNITQPVDKGVLLKEILENNPSDKFNLSDKAVNYMSRLRDGKPRFKHRKNNLNGKSFCLLAVQYKGVPYGVIEDKRYADKYRRLTPLECERLQTVNDGYTSIVSNTQRYKMLGNGWTVDVVAHILKNII